MMRFRLQQYITGSYIWLMTTIISSTNNCPLDQVIIAEVVKNDKMFHIFRSRSNKFANWWLG